MHLQPPTPPPTPCSAWVLGGSTGAMYLRAATWLFIVGAVSDKAATFAAHRNVAAVEQCDNRGLPDLVLDYAPDWGVYKIPDFFLYTFAPSLFVYGLRGVSGAAVLYRASAVFGLVLLVRALTIICTSYPSPGAACRLAAADIPWRWWGNSLFLWFRTCGDYMFSGHTSALCLVSCVHTLHLGDAGPFDRKSRRTVLHCVVGLMWAMTLVGVASLLCSRFHYTDDVIIGLYVTCSTFAVFNLLPLVLDDAPWVHFCFGTRGRGGRPPSPRPDTSAAATLPLLSDEDTQLDGDIERRER